MTPSNFLPALLPVPVENRDRAATIAAPTESATFLPAHIARRGEGASRRFLEFFAAEIENDNTRATYYRAVCDFFGW